MNRKHKLVSRLRQSVLLLLLPLFLAACGGNDLAGVGGRQPVQVSISMRGNYSPTSLVPMNELEDRIFLEVARINRDVCQAGEGLDLECFTWLDFNEDGWSSEGEGQGFLLATIKSSEEEVLPTILLNMDFSSIEERTGLHFTESNPSKTILLTPGEYIFFGVVLSKEELATLGEACEGQAYCPAGIVTAGEPTVTISPESDSVELEFIPLQGTPD